MSPDARDVLDFWFAEENAARRYVADAAFDNAIRQRFGRLAEAAAEGHLDDWVGILLAGWCR